MVWGQRQLKLSLIGEKRSETGWQKGSAYSTVKQCGINSDRAKVSTDASILEEVPPLHSPAKIADCASPLPPFPLLSLYLFASFSCLRSCSFLFSFLAFLRFRLLLKSHLKAAPVPTFLLHFCSLIFHPTFRPTLVPIFLHSRLLRLRFTPHLPARTCPNR